MHPSAVSQQNPPVYVQLRGLWLPTQGPEMQQSVTLLVPYGATCKCTKSAISAALAENACNYGEAAEGTG